MQMLARGIRGIFKLLFALACVAVAAYAFTYLLRAFKVGDPFAAQFAMSGWDVPLHFFVAGLALLLSPLQLNGWLRRTWPRLHRLGGWLYMGAVLVGGLSGLSLSFAAQGGPLARLGFFTLSLVWIAVTMRGVQLAVKGDFERHRRWMCRSVAITFGAVTLRLMIGVGAGALSLSFMAVYAFAAWGSWLLNLAVCECLLRWPHRTSQPPVHGRHSVSGRSPA